MNPVGLLGLFVGLLANACLGSQLDEFQINGLSLAEYIDQKIMDMDIKRFGMNEMNKMEVCEDQKSEKWCKKQKKKGKCSKYAKECKKTCDLCDDQTDNCDDTLHQLHCLSECPTPVNGSNPANYHHILGRCYYFQTTPMNFTDAMDECMTIFGTPGGRLFEPRNTEVNEEVAKKASVFSGPAVAANRWWIGIRAVPDRTPRHFYWLSGGPFTSLSFGNWIDGEPNDSGEEDCVELGGFGDDRFPKWNDKECFDSRLSICEQGHQVIW